jgi:hypothetical protein
MPSLGNPDEYLNIIHALITIIGSRVLNWNETPIMMAEEM